MKKKKFNGLSLNKNVISKLNSSAIRGGIEKGTKDYDTASAALPCFSRDCVVLTGECAETEINCLSIRIACE
ncbi:class I lanthipeptide [uncultured Lacinutrix sp.]|uniref:class I lanthipeptide n=1 Tax=uncultured Lacinutrix sp. TaxID=574032 RepID=UPI0026130876|nr:class I lanthipeptide [uncultured Lacinutrix sp.]